MAASPELLGIIVAGINRVFYEGHKPTGVMLGLGAYCDLMVLCGLPQEDPPKIISICGLPVGILLDEQPNKIVVLFLDGAKS